MIQSAELLPLKPEEIERCYQQFLIQNGMEPVEERRGMIIGPGHHIDLISLESILLTEGMRDLPMAIATPKITLNDVNLEESNRWRWYGKSIYESMITRPTPDHILRTVHYLNRWLRWLNFGIVY